MRRKERTLNESEREWVDTSGALELSSLYSGLSVAYVRTLPKVETRVSGRGTDRELLLGGASWLVDGFSVS